MNDIVRKIGVASALVSFLLCLGSGFWILRGVGFQSDDDAVWTGIGLYFVGKAFFVGPMLVVTSLSIRKG